MVKPLLLIPPLVFAGLAVAFWLGMERKDPAALPSAFIEKPAPAVSVQPFAADPGFKDADLRDGKIRLVNFWASWCAPCRAEHPQLESLSEEGVEIFGVNYKDDPAKAQAFLDELGNPFTRLGSDANGRMGLDWGLYGVPETFVIDGDGKVLARIAGPLTPEIVEDQIEPLMGGSGE